jgi:hypothetical protein
MKEEFKKIEKKLDAAEIPTKKIDLNAHHESMIKACEETFGKGNKKFIYKPEK